MSENREEILEKIRERVFEREKELKTKEKKEAEIESTLEALEAITDVPREEMDRIAAEIRAAHEAPLPTSTETALVPTADQVELPATVREALNRLPRVFQTEFMEEYRLQSRNTVISYLLWLIPPPFSGHYLYMKKPFRQTLFFLTCGGVFLWWLVDLFRIPEMVRQENRNIARKQLRKLLRRSGPGIEYKK